MKFPMGTREFRIRSGRLLLAADDDGLTHAVYLDRRGQPMRAPRIPSGSDSAAARTILRDAERQLREYFNGRRRNFDLPLSLEGTEFQHEVWDELCAIPFGATTSYGELAQRIGRPRAVRAVGTANGSNPVSIIVPCHRVIGHNRTLTGYGGGLNTKRTLLQLEGIAFDGSRVAGE